MVLISDNLAPFFRVIIAGGHNDCHLFCPSRTKLQYTLVNLHGDRARIRNNHRLTGQQVFTVILVVVENIANQRIDCIIISENGFHLSQFTLALFDNFVICVQRH